MCVDCRAGHSPETLQLKCVQAYRSTHRARLSKQARMPDRWITLNKWQVSALRKQSRARLAASCVVHEMFPASAATSSISQANAMPVSIAQLATVCSIVGWTWTLYCALNYLFSYGCASTQNNPTESHNLYGQTSQI